jgi:hypothetical protein
MLTIETDYIRKQKDRLQYRDSKCELLKSLKPFSGISFICYSVPVLPVSFINEFDFIWPSFAWLGTSVDFLQYLQG